MTWWEILILVVVCVGFVAALGACIYNKIKGKTGCDCGGHCASGGCDGCCAHCHSRTAPEVAAPEHKE